MGDPPEEGAFALPVLWRGLDEEPILYANQFVVQHEQDELLVTIGQFQPPILLGDANERVEQAKRLGYVPVYAVARFAFTRTRLGELVDILNQHLQKYDDAHEGRDR